MGSVVGMGIKSVHNNKKTCILESGPPFGGSGYADACLWCYGGGGVEDTYSYQNHTIKMEVNIAHLPANLRYLAEAI